MTVLLPWPLPAMPAMAGVQALRPPGLALKPSAAARPPCTPMALSPAGFVAASVSAPSRARPVLSRHALALRAGMAELLLLARLRARTRRGQCQKTLEHAARVIEVTARHWLLAPEEGPAPDSAAGG